MSKLSKYIFIHSFRMEFRGLACTVRSAGISAATIAITINVTELIIQIIESFGFNWKTTLDSIRDKIHANNNPNGTHKRIVRVPRQIASLRMSHAFAPIAIRIPISRVCDVIINVVVAYTPDPASMPTSCLTYRRW